MVTIWLGSTQIILQYLDGRAPRQVEQFTRLRHTVAENATPCSRPGPTAHRHPLGAGTTRQAGASY